jgi:hypothetical protein
MRPTQTRTIISPDRGTTDGLQFDPGRLELRPIYPIGQGTPVVTVWRDRIEADADGVVLRRPKVPKVHA